jgi:putative ABC transport system permease protein
LSEGVVDNGFAVATLTGAAAEDAAAAAAALRAGGVVVADERFVVDGRVTVIVGRSDRLPNGPDKEMDLPSVTVPAYVLRTGVLVHAGAIYSPQVVARAGFRTALSGLLAATTRVPTQAEQDRLVAELRGIDPATRVWVERGPQVEEPPELLALAIAAGLITLGAAGIATGLAAADARPDHSALAAVGASPRVRRLMSLSQSGVIAGLGSLLGVVAGLGASLAVLYALNQGRAGTWPIVPAYPLVVPWQPVTIALAVPLVAMLGAGLLTRSRLPVERRPG